MSGSKMLFDHSLGKTKKNGRFRRVWGYLILRFHVKYRPRFIQIPIFAVKVDNFDRKKDID